MPDAPTEPSGATAKTGSANVETGGEGSEADVRQRDATRARNDQGAGARGAAGRGDQASRQVSGGPVAAGKMAKHCPTTIGRPTCEALAEAAGKPREGGHEAVETGACTEVLEKADCEAIDALRERAEEAPDPGLISSAEFKACLEDPTPRCKRLLGPILKREQESREAGG